MSHTIINGNALGSGTGGFILTDPNSVTYSYAIQFQDGSGVSATYKAPDKKRVGPRLYFNYVKSKLNKVETKRLKTRLGKLKALIQSAEDSGQTALYEQFSKMLVVAMRESEIVACGYRTFVDLVHINKFRSYVTENDRSNVNPIEFKKLEEYPRVVPDSIKKIIKAVQKKGIFEELWVLYLDYAKEPIKSNKEKIREKDPILFGRCASNPDRFYFIADWVDEFCDLTLSEFVDTIQKNDPTYNLSEVDDLTPEYLETLKKEIKDREDRLQATRPNNFRDLMVEEEKAKIERAAKEEQERLEQEATRLRQQLDESEQDRIDAQRVNQHLSQQLEAAKPWYKRWFSK